MVSGLIKVVAARFIEASLPIEVKEVEVPGLGTNIEVSGPYDKMKDLIPYLRGKLEYRSRDKTWWVSKAKMTPLKIKNLQKKVNEVNGTTEPTPKEKKEEESAEVKEARKAEVENLFKRVTHLRIPGFKFSPGSPGIRLSGDCSQVRIEINKSGGEYGPEVSKFYSHIVDPKGFENLIEALESKGKELTQAINSLNGLLPRNFMNLKINVDLSTEQSHLIVSGKTYDLKDEIKSRVLVIFNKGGSYWMVPVTQVKPAQVKELLEYLEGKDRAIADKWKAEKSEKTPAAERKRPNQKGGHCHDCGGWVNPGEGWLFNWYDPEPGDFVWKVQHKDSEDCAKVKAERKIRNEAARTKGEARRNLMLMCTKSEYLADGTDNRPPGEQIWIDKNSVAYGGGSWVVIEPGENYFWYVDNNGADGDDWSRNNVQTGGAGAIGYRLPMTDEARVLIDVAKEG